MEKTILSPKEFLPRYAVGDEPKTRAQRTVGTNAQGEWVLRLVPPGAGAAESAGSFWLLDEADCKALLIDALKHGKLTMAEYTALQKELRPPETPKKPAPKPASGKPREECICRSEGVEIGLLKDERPYLRLDGEEYTLSSQPFETSTLIRKNSRVVVTLRNAFEIYGAYDLLAEGGSAESAAGRKYDAPALCALLAAALRVNRETLEFAELEAMLAPDGADEAAEEPEAEGTSEADALPDAALFGDGTRSGFLYDNFKD
jgi:hypothetical protein